MQLSFDHHAAARQPLSWMFGPVAGAAPAASPLPALPTTMRRGQTLAIDQPQVVICTEGTLWVTHDHMPEDHIVEAGGRCAAGRSRMLVHAMTDARVEFVAR